MYTDAVNLHGLPNRVRSNLGEENIEVWHYMIEQHSSNEAVVTSAHNERIELMEECISLCRCCLCRHFS